MRTRVRLMVLIGVTSVAIAMPARAQGTPQRPQLQYVGSARITGRVLAQDNGAPVRRARVTLAGTPEGATNEGPNRAFLQRAVETDDNGAFTFTNLPGGSYTISVSRTNGFLDLADARQAIVGEGRAIDVSIRLERSGAIVGRIADTHGAGVLGVEVVAIRRNNFRGHVTLIPGSRASTNDLGQFRLFNLPPGEYLVVATPVASTPIDAPRDPAIRRFGFVTTYYPGSQSIRNARRVVVRSGHDTKHVDFSLTSGPFARVAIDTVDSRGRPLGREATATLNVEGAVDLMSSTRQASRPENGEFVFSEVPLGDYDLIVSTSYRQEEAAYVNVKVDGDVTLKLQTNTGARVSGRFVVQGTPRDSNSGRPFPNVGVTARPPLGKWGPSYMQDPLVHPQGTDRFELTGLRGPVSLHADMSGAALVSISRAGGEDLAGKTLQLTGTEIIDDLLVVFTRAEADVDVTVTGLREPADPERVLVILFSEDPARWHAGSVQYTVIQATAEMPLQPADRGGASRRDGWRSTLRLGSMVPGRYLLAAVPTPTVSYLTDPDILERLRPLAVPVTLVAGESAKVELGVSR